jgi:hypothetical protein
MSKAQLSHYKKALVQKGVIIQDKNKIVFRIPRFKEFIEFIKELEDERQKGKNEKGTVRAVPFSNFVFLSICYYLFPYKNILMNHNLV